MKLKMTVNGTVYEVDVEVDDDRHAPPPIVIGGGGGGSAPMPATAKVPGAPANSIVAPLAGSVSKILVNEGDDITAGQVVLILEAMKMETEISAPADGKVESILVNVRDSVQGGQALIALAG